MAASWMRIGDVIPRILRDFSPPDEVTLQQICDAWPTCVGDAVVAHTTPFRYENGTLYVRVSNHIWLAELRSGLGRTILATMREKDHLNVRNIQWISPNDSRYADPT